MQKRQGRLQGLMNGGQQTGLRKASTRKGSRGKQLAQAAQQTPQKRPSPSQPTRTGADLGPATLQIGEFIAKKHGGQIPISSSPSPPAGTQPKRKLPDSSGEAAGEAPKRAGGGGCSSTEPQRTSPAHGAQRSAIQPQRHTAAGGSYGGTGSGGGYGRGGGGHGGYGSGSYRASQGDGYWNRFQEPSRKGVHGMMRPPHRQQTAVTRSRPLGMTNLGNTCYLNATLQVLLSLQPFVGDLEEAAQRRLRRAGDADSGIAAELTALARSMAAAKGQPAGDSLSPEPLKEALERRMSAFQGGLQQDAHEFLCALLEALQAEVVRREADATTSRRVPLSATACPAARNFSFCIEHQVTCGKCGKETRLQEQFMHLSLELPEGSDAAARLHAQALLRDHLQDEEVEKTCEGCGAENAAHHVHHMLRRLPRVLALHFKRFRVQMSPGGSPRFRKMHARIAVPQSLQLAPDTDAATCPPLPLRHKPSPPRPASSGEKENSPGAANRSRLGHAGGGRGAANGSAAEPFTPKRKSEEELQLEEALRRSVADTHVSRGARRGSPDIRAACGGDAFDALLCAEEGSGGLGSRTPSIDGGCGSGAPTLDEEAALQSALKASAEEAEAESLRRATAAAAAPMDLTAVEPPSIGDLFSGTDGDASEAAASPASAAATRPASSCDGVATAAAKGPAAQAAADAGAKPPASAAKPPPDWFEVVEDAAPPPDAARPPLKANYTLRGVINHLGSGPASGHFTADVLDVKSGRWHRHNDSIVERIWPDADAGMAASREETAYILVYVADDL